MRRDREGGCLEQIILALPASVTTELEVRARKDGSSVEGLITKAVAEFLETPLHTFFQVSTSRSLVAGQYTGAITCAKLLEHGDFGLGTFAGLAGEMVIVDGHAYRVEGSGRISQAEPNDEVPSATVTRLDPNVNETLEGSDSFDNLKPQLDRFRRTDNLANTNSPGCHTWHLIASSEVKP